MSVENNTLNTLLNEHDLAKLTGLSVSSVRRWRLFKRGPKYLKISSSVRYRVQDVKAWLDSLDSQPGGGPEEAQRK
jgi:predicted DNA-binding transcriptional regulator AlpA